MNDAGLLLRAILAHPDEVTIRNQCADWFQEFRPELPAVPAILLRPDGSDYARAMLEHAPEMVQSWSNLAGGRPWRFCNLPDDKPAYLIQDLMSLQAKFQRSTEDKYTQRSTMYVRHEDELTSYRQMHLYLATTIVRLRELFIAYGLPQIELAPWLPHCVAIWVAAPASS